MERDQMLEHIGQARALLRKIIDTTNLPMIEQAVREADMNLHWAQWNLGAPTSLMPELED